MEHSLYHPKKRWIVFTALKAAALCMILGYVFYNKLYACILMSPCGVIMWMEEKRTYILSTKKRIREEFVDFIYYVSTCLEAGYSLEGAFVQGLNQYEAAPGTGVISEGLKRIANGLELNYSLEQMLLEFGEQCEVKEIRDFGELIQLSKRFGGNIISVIKATEENYREKSMVEKEIETLIAAKRLEGKIMLLSPIMIILYMRLVNRSYMDILYYSLPGKIVMTMGVVIILTATLWINKIVRIEV